MNDEAHHVHDDASEPSPGCSKALDHPADRRDDLFLARQRGALEAATELEAEGVSVEVIDPRTVSPLDIDTIVASVKKTGRLVIAHQAYEQGGIGAEIVARVQEAAFDYLDAPIQRVAGKNVPIPYNEALERAALPGKEEIIAAVKRVV